MSPARREVVAEAAVVVALALLCIAFCAPSLTQAYVFNDWVGCRCFGPMASPQAA